ncbi:MAG: cytochrome c [Myxococcales bacterium]|nr:cytochrome c [Myxococcales bacterium]
MSAYPEEAFDPAWAEAIWGLPGRAPQPTTGEGLYLDYCRNCHGVDALGGVVGKDISDKGYQDAYERVRVGAGLGDPGQRMLYMPAFGTEVISDEELMMITDYIATL